MSKAAQDFLRDAHANHHSGPIMLRRWAMSRNMDRRHPSRYVSQAVLDEAIAIEAGAQDTLPIEEEAS